jgi:hypothetical protein
MKGEIFIYIFRLESLNWPLFPDTRSGGNPPFLEMSVVYNTNKPEMLRVGGGYCSETRICQSVFTFSGKQEFNYWKLFSIESSVSSYKVCVNLFLCIPYTLCHLRQIVSEFC